MKRQFFLFSVLVLVLLCAGKDIFAQPALPTTTPRPATTPPTPLATPSATPTPPSVTRTPPSESSSGSARARELAEQLRRSRAAQSNRSGTQSSRQSGLLAMNLTGLETFGDALGGIPQGVDTFFIAEPFIFNSGMFSAGTNVSGGQFSGNITSLTGGPAIPFSLPVVGGTADPSYLPSSLASEIVAYLGQGAGGAFDVDFSPNLVSYAMAHGIDPSQLEAASVGLGPWQIVYNYTAEYQIPTAPGGVYGLGRQKIMENMTPVPTDRLIFDYSFFHNVPLPYRKMPVNRFTPGFEKTFFDKRFSFEMRFPFAATIDNTLYTNNANQLNVLRWGDATAVLKWLVFSGKRTAVTLGVGTSLPFAEDSHMIDAATGREVIWSKHQSVHWMPYVGFLYIPNDRVFFQSYFQIDTDGSGDSVYVSDLSDPDGKRMLYAGKTRERTYSYTSLALGYWLFREYCQHGNPNRGMNLMGELHWTQSLDRGAGVRCEQDNYIFNIGGDRGNYTVVNMTLGSRYLINEKTNVGIGYSVPLSNGNRQFDGELRITFNRYL